MPRIELSGFNLNTVVICHMKEIERKGSYYVGELLDVWENQTEVQIREVLLFSVFENNRHLQ